MGCESCFQSEKEQQRLRSIIFNQAKEFARQIGKAVVVYQTETGESTYMEIEAARSLNIFGPIVTPL